jgi:hypothetical protein
LQLDLLYLPIISYKYIYFLYGLDVLWRRRFLGRVKIYMSQSSVITSDSADLGISETHVESEKMFSIFPEAGSKRHFRLLNDWLRVCPATHNHTPYSIDLLPRRVIDVGWNENSTKLKLYDTKGVKKGVYIALSHRWGEDYEQYNTTTANFLARLEDIPFADLPPTFQHAVIATRRLSIQFLWIDSLCIIQDDDDDWARESKRMQDTFALAYFTIAATSAAVDKGFLYRSADHFARLGHDTSYAYISKAGADFNRDVEQGELNQRGWVLQERALSRRIIHFTAAQTYWECGSAIWCESNETIDYRSALSSSDFPKLDSSGSTGDPRSTFTDIFQRYSQLGLTKSRDRPVAVGALENRLQEFYRTESVYGIVRDFFGESLLWQGSNSQVEPIIDFSDNIQSFGWLVRKRCRRGLGWRTKGQLDIQNLLYRASPGKLTSNSSTRRTIQDAYSVLHWYNSYRRVNCNQIKTNQIPNATTPSTS